MSNFEPNQLTFDEGLRQLQAVLQSQSFQADGIVTSKDPGADALREALRVTNVPSGFSKWQLPVYLNRPSQLYISVGAPGTHTPEHSHDEGDGLRFIASGSIQYNSKELAAGDWMFIPAGKKYSFDVGPLGATMFYCYCCSCAGHIRSKS